MAGVPAALALTTVDRTASLVEKIGAIGDFTAQSGHPFSQRPLLFIPVAKPGNDPSITSGKALGCAICRGACTASP